MNTTNILCVKQNLRKYPINISFLWNKSYDLKHQRNRWGQTLRPEKSGINLNLFSEICKWKNGRKLLNMRKDMLFRKGETWKEILDLILDLFLLLFYIPNIWAIGPGWRRVNKSRMKLWRQHSLYTFKLRRKTSSKTYIGNCCTNVIEEKINMAKTQKYYSLKASSELHWIDLTQCERHLVVRISIVPKDSWAVSEITKNVSEII